MTHSMQLGYTKIGKGRRTVLSASSVFPGEAISSEALCKTIRDRFGISTRVHERLLVPRLKVAHRHLCRDFEVANEAPRPGDRNPELAIRAMQKALDQAGLPVNELAYLISHTTTPAQLLPGGSFEIAQGLHFAGPHMELRQACTGFANALQIAFAMTASPDDAPVAIVGSETGSVYFSPYAVAEDKHQWVNFLQMGDGAAAIIIAPDMPSNVAERGIGSITAPYFGQCQQVPPSGLRLLTGGSDYSVGSASLSNLPILFEHDYASVAEHGAFLFEAGRTVLAQQGYAIEDAHCLIPHQASGAIASWLAQRWGIPEHRISHHAQQVGNLGSASIWAALVDCIERQRQRDAVTRQPVLVFGAEATQYSYGGFAFEFS